MQRILKFKIDKEEICFGSSPYFFDDVEGLSSSESEFLTYQKINSDGIIFGGANLSERNIHLVGKIRGKTREEAFIYRRKLINLCNSKRGIGRFIVEYTSGENYFINAVANSVDIKEQNTSSIPSNVFEFDVSFICPDPFWRQEDIYSTHFSQVIPCLEFEMDIDLDDDDDMKFGEVYYSHNTILDNKGDVPSGFTCIAKGKMTDYFVLKNIDTGEFIRFDRDFSDIDSIEIYSEQGNKKVFFNYKNGIRENALKHLDLNSSFFYLKAGENKLQFETNSKDVDLEVVITHHNLYAGI